MKKTIRILQSILTWLLAIASVCMMIFTVVSVSLFDKNDRDLFGYKAFIILSDSMSTTDGDPSRGYFNAGDLILVKEVMPEILQPGDIISYISTNTENYGKTVSHMIRERTTDVGGNPGFITYGTATGTNDDNVVTYPYVLGQYRTRIPGVGSFFLFLKTTPGYLVCILLPFLLLIGMQGFQSIRLFKKYKKEQLEEIEAIRRQEQEALAAERAALAEERRRSEEMMQQLLAMQATLQEKASQAEKTPPAKDNDSSAT